MGLFKKKNTKKVSENEEEKVEVKERQPNHWAFDDDPILNLDPVFTSDNESAKAGENASENEGKLQENDSVMKEHLAKIKAKKPALSGQLGQVIANAQKNSDKMVREIEANNPVISKLRRIEEARRSGVQSDDLYTDLTKSELNSYSNRARDYLEKTSNKPYESDLQRARRLEAEHAERRKNNADYTLSPTRSFNFKVAEKNSEKIDRFQKNSQKGLDKEMQDIERTSELVSIQESIEEKMKLLLEKERILNEKQKELVELEERINNFQKMYGKKPETEDLIQETKKHLQKNESDKIELKKSVELLKEKANNSSQSNVSPLPETKKTPAMIVPRKREKLSLNSRGNDRYLDPTIILPREKPLIEEIESIEELPEKNGAENFKTISKNFQKLEKKIDRLLEKTITMELEIQNIAENPEELATKTFEIKNNFVKAMRKINKEMPKIKSDFQNLSLKERRKQIYENASIASSGRANKLKIIKANTENGGFEKVQRSENAWQSNYHKQLQNHGNVQYMRDRNPIFERMMRMNEKANMTLTMEIPAAKANQRGWNNTLVMAKARELDSKQDTIEFKKAVTSPNSKKSKNYFKK